MGQRWVGPRDTTDTNMGGGDEMQEYRESETLLPSDRFHLCTVIGGPPVEELLDFLFPLGVCRAVNATDDNFVKPSVFYSTFYSGVRCLQYI